MFTIIHHIITWGIGSTGPLCETLFQDASQDIADVNCVTCLKSIIAYERSEIETLKDDIKQWREFAEEAHAQLRKVDPNWRPSS